MLNRWHYIYNVIRLFDTRKLLIHIENKLFFNLFSGWTNRELSWTRSPTADVKLLNGKICSPACVCYSLNLSHLQNCQYWETGIKTVDDNFINICQSCFLTYIARLYLAFGAILSIVVISPLSKMMEFRVWLINFSQEMQYPQSLPECLGWIIHAHSAWFSALFSFLKQLLSNHSICFFLVSLHILYCRSLSALR